MGDTGIHIGGTGNAEGTAGSNRLPPDRFASRRPQHPRHARAKRIRAQMVQPELERVGPCRVRQLIHKAFRGEHIGQQAQPTPPTRAHGQRRPP